MRLSRSARYMWGVVASLTLIAAVGLCWFAASVIVVPLMSGGPSPAIGVLFGEPSGPFLAWSCVNGLTAVMSLGLFTASVAHLALSGEVPNERRLLWGIVLVVGLQVGLLAYWVTNVRPRSTASTPVGA